ncbi:hypothetical protein [Actinophytocola sp.]|uniref:hypothetical protein n=1 Tax=Actinophytocola sp. TaxID=1872138 RepID=UPI002D40DB65|nr:hypothetical protein [Actinophytocola sp.]HYQ66178.1 hypothetical protein [Actinophytocola sp.]
MSLRNDIEITLRSWNRHEIDRGAPPIVDFDCSPPDKEIAAAPNRLAVRSRLAELFTAATVDNSTQHLAHRASAAITYLDALLGIRTPVRAYIKATQGCDAHGWPEPYIASVRDTAIQHLAELDVPWGPTTLDELKATEVQVDAVDAADVIQKYARELELDVRHLADSDAPFNLSIEHVDLDAYWAYWLDGAGANVRMRINSRRASFTDVQARQFALHEILGHGLQCASYAQSCQQEDVPWVRITSVHAQQQVLLEGLAQALPLFVCPNDRPLIARVRLTHYIELVRAKLHLAINDGASVPDCVAIAKMHAPFWTEDAIGDMLADRGVNPLLRTYLWAYPAGIDWFVRLADRGPKETARMVIGTAYRSPLTPDELSTLWPEGPPIGGETESTTKTRPLRHHAETPAEDV